MDYKVNKSNKNESLEQISQMLQHILRGLETGTHRESYLDYEIYGCLEKTSKGNIKVRISEKAYNSYKDQFDKLKIYYKDDDGLKHIPGDLKSKLHAEHIYPRVKLKEDLKNLGPDYAPKEIEKLLSKRAKGILITKEECKKLDEGKLKSDMPENWKKNKSVDERLAEKEISIHQENGNDVYYTISSF